MSKRTIVLDFDGVLHSYTSGWQGADVIPDPPVDGAVTFVQELVDRGFDVKVLSTRLTNGPDAAMAMESWMVEHGFPVYDLEFIQTKAPALLYVDDRGWRFEGPEDFLRILGFAEGSMEPWNKGEAQR